MKTNRGLITTCELDNNFSLALSLAPPAPLLFLDFPPSYLHLPPLPSHLRLDLSLSLHSPLHTFKPRFPTLFAFLFSLARCHSPSTLHHHPPVHSSFSLSLRFYLLFPSLDLSPSCLLLLLLLSFSLSLLVLVSRLLAWTTNERRPYGTARTDAPIKLSKTVCMNSQAFPAHVPLLSTDN